MILFAPYMGSLASTLTLVLYFSFPLALFSPHLFYSLSSQRYGANVFGVERVVGVLPVQVSRSTGLRTDA